MLYLKRCFIDELFDIFKASRFFELKNFIYLASTYVLMVF